MEICQHNLPSIRIGVKEICAGQMLSDSVSHVFWSRDSGDGQSTKSDKSQTYLPAHNHDVKLGDFDDREWFVFRFPLKKSCVATATPFPRLTWLPSSSASLPSKDQRASLSFLRRFISCHPFCINPEITFTCMAKELSGTFS